MNREKLSPLYGFMLANILVKSRVKFRIPAALKDYTKLLNGVGQLGDNLQVAHS